MDNEETVDLEDEIKEEEIFIEEESNDESEDKDWKAEALKLQAILDRKQKQAEKAAEAPKAPEPPADTQINQSPQPDHEAVTPEDLLRTTKGYDDETLAELRAIAKGKDISLFKAQEDSLFTAFLEKKDSEEKASKAKLGASNGSGRTGTKKGFTTPGLSAEEHKAMWKDKTGR